MVGLCRTQKQEIKEVMSLPLTLNMKDRNYSLLFYPHITSSFPTSLAGLSVLGWVFKVADKTIIMVASKKLARQGYGVFDDLLLFVGDTQLLIQHCNRVGHSLCCNFLFCNPLLSILFLALNGKVVQRKSKVDSN